LVYKYFSVVLLFISVLSGAFAIPSYIDPAGYPYPWPDNPSPALASYEFNSLSDLADYYPTGSWSVAGGILSITGSGERRAILDGDEGWDDYVVRSFGRITGGIQSGGSGYAIYVRVTGTARNINAYAFQVDPGLGNRFALRKVTDGRESGVLVWGAPAADFDWLEWHEVTIVARENSFTMYVDGIEVLRYTDNDNPFMNGRVGLRSWGPTQVEFDYVRVNESGSATSEWIPYTYSRGPIYDASGNSDNSNGGTSPRQEGDFVSSQNLPSIQFFADCDNLMFRMVLASNPLQLTGSGAPYKSSTWNILIDIDGDGYRDFAIELDGTDQGVAPDDIKVYFSTIKDQYLYDSDLIWKQDSARHLTSPTDADGEPGRPADWDRDPSPLVRDFGRTRVIEYVDPSLGTVYLLDIQVPLAALDATSRGGPKLTTDDIFQLAFTTSSNTNNPIQKDLAFQGTYSMALNKPIPFGDLVNSCGHISQIPLTSSISVSGCGPSMIEAFVLDSHTAVSGVIRSTVTSVKFYYYFDYNGNGVADDGFEWVLIGDATAVDQFNPWRFQWNNSQVPQGDYIIKAVVRDNQGNTMDSYVQYNSGELRKVALLENTCSSISLTVSGKAFEDRGDNGGPFVSGVDLPKTNVRVRIYREADGNDVISNGDVFVAETNTDANGNYSFGPLPQYRYYVVVDSKSVAPTALNPGFPPATPWAEQTFKREFKDGAYNDVQAFGGLDPSISDRFATWSKAISQSTFQHLSVVDLSGSAQAVSGIDHGFSFNVIVNTNDTGDNGFRVAGNQGTLRQFVLNSNAIAGANAARFVMQTPQNSSSGSNSWWTIQPMSALPDITDIQTTIDGTVYTVQGNIINSNGSNFGGGLAGVDKIAIPPLNGKEIEIDSNGLEYVLRTSATAQGFSLKNIAFFNGGGTIGDVTAPVVINGQNFNLDNIVSGARADGSRPEDSSLNRRYGLVINASGTLKDSYIAYNGSGLLLTGNTIDVNRIIVLDNGIGPSGTDGNGVSIVSPAISVTLRNSIVESNGGSHAGVTHGNGVYTQGDKLTLLENTTIVDSTASAISLNESVGAVIRKSIVNGSLSGPGIRVSSDSSYGDFSLNSFGDNRGLAIDLLRSPSSDIIEGVNPNDGLLNANYGNMGVDHPVIALATRSGSALSIQGFVGQNTPSAVFAGSVVEIYSARAGDGDSYSGEDYGEGIKYIGSLIVDSQGNFEGNVSPVSEDTKVITAITRYESFSNVLGIPAYATSEFGPNKSVGSGLKISGYVYEDLNFNRTRDYAEPGIAGVRLKLWKFDGSGWTFQSYTQTDNEGFYSFDVSQGTYRVVEDAQNLFNSSTEGSDPVGYISTTPNWVEVIVDTVNKTADFGDFRGFIVKGFIFDDSGAGVISQANNATRDPGEAQIPGVLVTLTNGSDKYTRYTDQDGLYRFFVSGDPVYPIVIRETDLPAYTSTGDHDSGGSAPLDERNTITINSNVDSFAFYNFADVKRLLIEGINTVSGLPGNTVNLDHSLLVATYGSVSLETISSQGFGIAVYELDSAGNVLGLWDNNIARSPARYYLRLTANIPTEAISGTFDAIKVRAVQDWSNSVGSDRAETYDTITVGAEGLSLRKETRNFSISGDWGLSSEGKPGEIIEYRISFANNGTLSIPSVVITDPLDRDLQLLQSSYSMGSSRGNVILSVDGSERLLVAEDGGDLNLDWAFCEGGVLTVNITKIIGALQPGSSGWLIFKTRLRR
jgi:uncharacterized repeat protein (TIGR01451 family)